MFRGRQVRIVTSPPLPSPPHDLAPIAEAEAESDSSQPSIGPIDDAMVTVTARPFVIPSDSPPQRIVTDIIDTISTISPEEELPQLEPIDQGGTIERRERTDEERGESTIPEATTPAPSSRPIIFPILPFYGRKATCSRCNIYLGLLFVFFFLLSIALFLAWAIVSHGFSNLGGLQKVCSSKECIDTAFRLSSYMDASFQPCDNFYRYSCNNFHLLNEDKQINFLDQLRDTTYRSVNTLLSTGLDARTRSGKLAQLLYSMCMDGGARSQLGNQPLFDLLRNLPCGPLLIDCQQQFNPDFYNWERHSGMLDYYAGEFNFIVFDRDVDPQSRSRLILQFRPPILEQLIGPIRTELVRIAHPGPTELYPLLQISLRQNLLNNFVALTLMRDPAEVQDQIDEVAQLMVDIYRATEMAEAVSPNTTYMPISQFMAFVPQINVAEILNADLSSVYKWTEADPLSVQNPEYFIQLTQIIARAPKRALANYLMTVTGLNLRQFSFDTAQQFSWRDCVDQLIPLEPVAKMYIQKRDNFTTQRTLKFLESLKDDFLSSHRQYPLQYLGPINPLAFHVGYPKRLVNEDQVWRPFSTLVVNQTDYFSSITRVLRQQRSYQLSQIGTFLDSDDSPSYSILSPTIIYNRPTSTLVLPISFLQFPISTPSDNVPLYAIYATLGVTVHQMIAKIFWSQLDKRTQLQCLDNIYRGFLNPNYRNNLDIQSDLLYTIELADSLKTTSYGYLRWQSDNMVTREQSLRSYDNLDSVQNMMLIFGTLFCNTEGEQPGSEYEAMMNTVATNTKLYSIHFQCTNETAIYNRRACV